MKLSLNDEFIKSALLQSMKPHKHKKYYHTNSSKHGSGSSSSSTRDVLIISFPWEDKDLYEDDHFGETDVDHSLFQSLRRVSEDRPAKVNTAFQQRFKDLLNYSEFKTEVDKAVRDGKKILLTGHSFGGAIASLATLWILEEYIRKQEVELQMGCITFGAPLIGDKTFSHAVRREKWADHFTHFVMEHDIVPRMMLATKISIQEPLPNILKLLQQKVEPSNKKPHKFLKLFNKTTPERTIDYDPDEAVAFFENVMINASAVASHVAFSLMEPSNSLMEKLSAEFVKVSPYRPFGTYIFCTHDETQAQDAPRQQLVVENPNAALQLLFYFLQLTNENQNKSDFALNSLAENLSYEGELNKNGLQLQNWTYLKHLNDHLLAPDGTAGDAVCTSNKALSELSVRARCCLMAAEEEEKRKKENEKMIDNSMRKYQLEGTRSDHKVIEDILDEIQGYKEKHAKGQTNYYDAFTLQNQYDDFVANVNRLELAKIFDEIEEMIMREDLPDEFEGREEWVKLGTEFRLLVEPLDISNYYRHAKGEGYMKNRPKRYKFTQRRHEHAHRKGFELISESNFIAEIEELKKEIEETKKKPHAEVKNDIERVENKVQKWISEKKIPKDDVLWVKSKFSMLRGKLS